MSNPRSAKRKYFQRKPGQDGNKRSKREDLAPGMRGFLVSCSQGNETRSVVEAYDVLNQHMDSENAKLENPSSTDTKDDPESDDPEKAMAEELKKYTTNAGIEERKARFKAVDSGCNNLIFISSAVENPSHFALSLLTDIHTTGKGRARYMQRIMPVVATCKADLESIKKAAQQALSPFFSGEANNDKTYLILYKTRNTGMSASRDDVIEAIGSVIKGMNGHCRANLNNPDCAVSVDVIKSLCLISVALDYCKLRKYNVHVDEAQSQEESRVRGNAVVVAEGGKTVEASKMAESTKMEPVSGSGNEKVELVSGTGNDKMESVSESGNGKVESISGTGNDKVETVSGTGNEVAATA